MKKNILQHMTCSFALGISTISAAQFDASKNQEAVTSKKDQIKDNQNISSSAPIDSLKQKTLKNIRIFGNQRIESETILAYIPIKPGETLSSETLDETLKALYATGYFTDIKVTQEGQDLVIHLEENPIINRISFEGNDKLKDDIIEQELKLRPREVLTHARIQEAQQRLLEIYRRMGRYGASVNPKIIKEEQNRVNLVFEIDEGDVTYVRKISFIGNKSFKPNELKEQLKTKCAVWYRFWVNDDIYDPDRFMADQQELRKFYYDRGFPDVRIIASQAELSPDKKDFYLTFQIDEGEHYTFGDFKINTKLKNVNLDELKKGVTFSDGDEFSGAHLEQTIMIMSRILGNQGYAFVAIEPIVEKDPKTKKAKITFEIKEGPRIYIENIIFKGNDRTRDHVLRREMALDEGDAYNSDFVKASERNLKSLGYFKKAEIETEQGSAPDKANLIAKVEEQPTGEVGFAGGFSTLDGPLAQIKFSERNLMGTGRIFNIELGIAKKRQDITIGLTEPYFLDRNMSLNTSIYSVRSTRFSSFTVEKVGFNVGVMYRLSAFWLQSLNYTFSLEHMKNAPDVVSPYLLSVKPSTSMSAITHSISYDRRNNSYRPTYGYQVGLNTTYAGLGGGVQYLQNILSGKYYYPFTQDITLIVKGEYGDLRKVKRAIRPDDRFNLGANSFRGFEYGEIGPRDTILKIDPKDDNVKTGLPGRALGGTRYWTGTVEVVFPIGLPNEFGVSGALFTDFGSLWRVGDEPTKLRTIVDDAKKEKKITYGVLNDTPKFRMAVGGGISWDSPFGSISIDYSRVLQKVNGDQEQRLLFGFSTRY